MNFQQLRIVRETARRNCNLTEVAAALYTSQSGVSKHIKDLEDELGVELYVRKGKRLLGMTEPGKELLAVVERMLHDAANIRRIAEQFTQRDVGHLVVATTHTQARYALPEVVAAFIGEYPKVHLALHQGSPREIAAMLLAGDADIGIATETLADEPGLATFPFYTWRHSVVVPRAHPLADRSAVTLAELVEHPVITYPPGYTGRGRIDAAFAAQGLVPEVAITALDADVIKTYVAMGLGVGIVTPKAFDAQRDSDLVRIDDGSLFAENVVRIAVRRGHYLRGFGYRFICLCSDALDEATVQQAIAPRRDDEIG